MGLERLSLKGAELRFDREWLPADEAAVLFDELRASVPWEVHRIHLFGREVDSPRLSCWIGDPDAAYRYSGARFEPRPWPATLAALRGRLERELGREFIGAGFNSVLANLYRGGRDAMGWHSDDEPELGAAPVIASVSLGATRRFVLKHRREPGRKLVIELPPGSLLVMAGDTQRNYRHALPRTAKVVGERINLTFRWVGPGPRAAAR